MMETTWKISIATILITFLAVVIYFLIKQRQKYWLRFNVPTIQESIFPARGNQYIQNIYMRFRNSGYPFVGCASLLTRRIVLLDLDLIKRMLISDFESFPDRGLFHNVKDDPLTCNLVRLDGELWRRIRSKLTLTFTSAKMKFMFPTIIEIGKKLIEKLNNSIESNETEVDIRNLCACFTTDIIGSVAFGIECNCLANPQTEFRIIGDKILDTKRTYVDFLGARFPRLFRFFHMKVFSEEVIQFYTKIVCETLAQRKREQIKRNDFVDILIELNKTHKTDNGEPLLKLNEIIGQMFGFFVGGFETSSNTLTFCLYELTQNPEIQEKTRTNVLETLKRFNGTLSYECINEMHYLKQVIAETLRKYPIAPTLIRKVRKHYVVPQTSIYLEKNISVIIPVYAIHHDPSYYAEPEKFNPERFSRDEIEKRHPMMYIPFGAGPRSCIAERFGKIEVSIGIAILMQHFRFRPTERTPKELQSDLATKTLLKFPNMFLNVEKLL